MKAYEARDLTYRSKEILKGIKEIDAIIKKRAEKGKFNTENILVKYDWGSRYDLEKHYEKQGFRVSTSHQQTSPNDGDDYIYLSWEDEG